MFTSSIFERNRRQRRIDTMVAVRASEGTKFLEIDDHARSRITEATERWGRNVGDWIQFATLGPASISLVLDGLNWPDLDIRMLGIGRHRSFAFHSALVFLLLYHIYCKRVERTRNSEQLTDHVFNRVSGVLLAAASLGTGIHLFTDVFQPKSVQFPGTGSLVNNTLFDDNLWLGGHALVCFHISHACLKMALAEDYPRFISFIKGHFGARANRASVLEGIAP